MKLYPKPNREDYEEFLIQVVYRPHSDYLTACIKAAYRDVCRTMRGFGRLTNKSFIHDKALATLTKQFKDLLANNNICNQSSFDEWHERINAKIIEIFRDGSFTLYSGQSQKWINMTFKNIYVCGNQRLDGFDSFYSYCHMPVDNIILGQLEKQGIKKPSKAWSKWTYPEYLNFQIELRSHFKNQPLLNVEHFMWIEGR